MKQYINYLKLNWRMLRHVAAGRRMSGKDVAAGYDALAGNYNRNISLLRPISERLLASLPEQIDGPIIDLGCGTGHTTVILENKYPEAKIIGIDISGGMLMEAAGVCRHSRLHQADMLKYISRLPTGSIELIVSAWSIGYSQPPLIITQAERILRPGGIFAFVVNLADTMHPVFYAYRRCMSAFPDRVNKAVWPHFPLGREELEKKLRRHNFIPSVLEESKIALFPPGSLDHPLPWLLQTGLLAGFDQAMPLNDPEIAAHFERELLSCHEPFAYHYVMILASRQ